MISIAVYLVAFYISYCVLFIGNYICGMRWREVMSWAVYLIWEIVFYYGSERDFIKQLSIDLIGIYYLNYLMIMVIIGPFCVQLNKDIHEIIWKQFLYPIKYLVKKIRVSGISEKGEMIMDMTKLKIQKIRSYWYYNKKRFLPPLALKLLSILVDVIWFLILRPILGILFWLLKRFWIDSVFFIKLLLDFLGWEQNIDRRVGFRQRSSRRIVIFDRTSICRAMVQEDAFNSQIRRLIFLYNARDFFPDFEYRATNYDTAVNIAVWGLKYLYNAYIYKLFQV
ncbi:hypothetical protein JTE90_022747 [Oedothorax gibbosus]|uniref:Gustatory receptor n=1 Tax=Oedothorax gibbosus TaxID=931172 RepID=A0AAV6UPH0_9ARAC|nr:hypothetical protein JTE90_022747 [Oedothorax gibbosus]